MMKDVPKMVEMTRRIVDATQIPVTVKHKVRVGRKHEEYCVRC